MPRKAFVEIPEGQIYYETEGSGPDLLLLHQGGLSSFEYSRMMPILARRYRVTARDMMGQGNSELKKASPNITDYALADINFMKAVGISKAAVMGIHTSAQVAAEIALNRPEMVDKLIFYGLPSFAPDVREACINSYSFGPVEVKPDGSHLTGRVWKTLSRLGRHLSPEDLNKVVLEAARAPGGTFTPLQACFRWQEEERVPLIKQPCLLLSGTDDVFHPRYEFARKLLKNYKTVVFENADDFAALEIPDKMAQAIIDFLG
ncbi:MAG: alpha/beta hydrolase [Chloroflexi bacterium]|nr:alpha/beta hydrolase [Chloroflexota bacterium]